MLLEILIELGVKRFINVGIAGGLQKTSHIGDVVVCTSAIRDEGVSYHYLEDPSAPALPSENLTAALKQTLNMMVYATLRDQHGQPMRSSEKQLEKFSITNRKELSPLKWKPPLYLPSVRCAVWKWHRGLLLATRWLN